MNSQEQTNDKVPLNEISLYIISTYICAENHPPTTAHQDTLYGNPPTLPEGVRNIWTPPNSG